MSSRSMLIDLLAYIEEQAKVIDPRVFRLSSARDFLKRRSDLAGLPGVDLDLSVEGDHVWLRVQRLHAALNATVNEAETRRKLEEGGIDVETSISPAAFAAFYAADQARWAPVVRRAGVRVE